MSSLDYLISIIAIACAVLSTFGAVKAHREIKIENRESFKQAASDNSNLDDSLLASNKDVTSTLKTIRIAAVECKNQFANGVDAPGWYAPLLEERFQISFYNCCLSCFRYSNGKNAAKVIDLLKRAFSIFVSAAEKMNLDESAIDQLVSYYSRSVFMGSIINGTAFSSEVASSDSKYDIYSSSMSNLDIDSNSPTEVTTTRDI